MEPEEKRRLMARFRSRDTKPEIVVRRLLHRLGYRFRIHVARLPGKPDIVLPKYRSAVFVHGCFWHRHAGCKVATVPKTRPDFWQAKFEGNIQRDHRNASELEAMGWQVITVWECETRDINRVAETLVSALESRKNARQSESGSASEGDLESVVMGRELELMAREIDPMAWKAWEVTSDIETRRIISIEKARTALRRIREIGGVALSRGASALSGVEEAEGPTEVAQATWAAIVDAITEKSE